MYFLHSGECTCGLKMENTYGLTILGYPSLEKWLNQLTSFVTQFVGHSLLFMFKKVHHSMARNCEWAYRMVQLPPTATLQNQRFLLSLQLKCFQLSLVDSKIWNKNYFFFTYVFYQTQLWPIREIFSASFGTQYI